MNEFQKELQGLKNRFEALPITELRGQASKVYGIKINRDMTKEDLVNAILGHVAKNNYAKSADGELQPGWSRIKLNNTGDYRSATPVHINANGFECFVPFGIEVDVPTRCLESLRNAVEYRISVNEFDEKVFTFQDSYPFQVIGTVDGPDPRPGMEVRREAKLRPKHKLKEKFGFYPTDKQFREFVTSGIFKLDPEDYTTAI